jgi:transcriptional regulator with XRE-family HTH domain
MTHLELLRRSRRMTQKDVASLLGLSQTAISYLEREAKTTTPDTAERLEEVFGKPVTELLSVVNL